jgi:hypothetical protein
MAKPPRCMNENQAAYELRLLNSGWYDQQPPEKKAEAERIAAAGAHRPSRNHTDTRKRLLIAAIALIFIAAWANFGWHACHHPLPVQTR